jgi:hypothetical protein
VGIGMDQRRISRPLFGGTALHRGRIAQVMLQISDRPSHSRQWRNDHSCPTELDDVVAR